MKFDMYAPKQAELSIDFLIIGGGIAGLACAVALRRVGHTVTVLEQDATLDKSTGGCRLPPNLTKILYHWGLQDQMETMSVKSEAIELSLFESGESMGRHRWDVEMLKEARGEFLGAYHAKVRKLLYDTAVLYGAKVRMNTRVSSVDPDMQAVTLTTGEILRTDVIVGADGVSGICRRLLTDEPDGQLGKRNMYSTVIRKESVKHDKELLPFFEDEQSSMMSWWGNCRSVLIFPIAGSTDIGMYVYGPRDGHEGSWEDFTPLEGLQKLLESSEPRLQRLAQYATSLRCIEVKEYTPLEDWVYEDGKLVVIGEAAHPLPIGSIHDSAMTVEDAAVLAKLFSHLRSKDQIGSFLWAFQDLRQPRCDFVTKKEAGDIEFLCMPPCEGQIQRDQMFRTKRDAGINVLSNFDEFEEPPEWSEIKEVFGYDAEDEADNWWVKWGLLRERANGNEVSSGLMLYVSSSSGEGISEAPISSMKY